MTNRSLPPEVGVRDVAGDGPIHSAHGNILLLFAE